MIRTAIRLYAALDLPMWKAANEGRHRYARALAVCQDLIELVFLRPAGKQITTVRPARGI